MDSGINDGSARGAQGALLRLPASKLLDKFAAGGHKLGSGSAAALLRLLACKLLQTVVSHTRARDAYLGVHDQLALVNAEIVDHIEPQLAEAVQRDSEQFHRVIVARQTRNAESDKAERRRLRDRVLAEQRPATEIPLQIAANCVQVAEQAVSIFDLGFRSARGDSGVAISAALAGASGSLAVVYSNLTSFRGGEWAREILERADTLNERTQGLHS